MIKDATSIKVAFHNGQSYDAKLVGGEAMVEAIERITNGTLTPRKNHTEEGRYFTWPTTEQARDFRKQGKKLV